MKRTLEISTGFTGTIPTGKWANEKPFFSLKETIEYNDNEYGEKDSWTIGRTKELQKICRDQFNIQSEISHQERIAQEYKNIRFYDGKNGIKYPSVTSIIGLDKDFFIDKVSLQQYASRGTIIDKQVEIYLKTGKWKKPKDIPETYPDLLIVKNGSLKLVLDNVNFIEFYKKYPFKVINQQKTCLNHEHKYGGRREIACIIESKNKGDWDKIKDVLFDVPTLLDLKCTASLDKMYVMKQNSAYAKCDKTIKQIGVIHLKADNQCGYAKPIIETNLDKYWTLFLKDREEMRNRYGV